MGLTPIHRIRPALCLRSAIGFQWARRGRSLVLAMSVVIAENGEGSHAEHSERNAQRCVYCYWFTRNVSTLLLMSLMVALAGFMGVPLLAWT